MYRSFKLLLRALCFYALALQVLCLSLTYIPRAHAAPTAGIIRTSSIDALIRRQEATASPPTIAPVDEAEAQRIRLAFFSEAVGHEVNATVLDQLQSPAIAANLQQESESQPNGTSSAVTARRRAPGPPQAPASVVDDLRYHQAYAAAAYCLFGLDTWTCRERCEATPGTVLVRKFSTLFQDITGYVAYNPRINSVIVAFRGTLSIRNVIVDLKLFPLDYDYPGAPAGAKVHSGFYKGYDAAKNEVRDAVRQVLAQNPGFTIRVIGHSLGGALASICALDLAREFPNYASSLRLITYGQPRVGNPAWANYLTQTFPDRVLRATNRIDIVPSLPPLFLGFQHHRHEYWINLWGNTVECADNGDPYVEDPKCSNSITVPDLISHLVGYYDFVFGPWC
ncbi:hypothetical protein HK102_003866 [Quaeritorhiza haematococci]|nr:hypothetical protein HK102_003866 [Quaeritorhiza haematococci]